MIWVNHIRSGLKLFLITHLGHRKMSNTSIHFFISLSKHTSYKLANYMKLYQIYGQVYLLTASSLCRTGSWAYSVAFYGGKQYHIGYTFVEIWTKYRELWMIWSKFLRKKMLKTPHIQNKIVNSFNVVTNSRTKSIPVIVSIIRSPLVQVVVWCCQSDNMSYTWQIGPFWQDTLDVADEVQEHYLCWQVNIGPGHG